MPVDLPISWASHLALISTGTSAVVFASKDLSSGSPELLWATSTLINLSEPLFPLL